MQETELLISKLMVVTIMNDDAIIAKQGSCREAEHLYMGAPHLFPVLVHHARRPLVLVEQDL